MSKIFTKSSIDDLYLHKYLAIKKIDKMLDFIDNKNSGVMIRTASADVDNLVTLFTNMLACLNLHVSGENVKNVIENLSKSSNSDVSIISTAKSVKGDRKDDIKIVSKTIRDSHYQIDISKDSIVKKGKKVTMISCYCRDAYLGRYLIKRNYYFSNERIASADSAYDEILMKMSAIKDRYYEGIIDVPGISYQMKTVLDGVISEIQFEEDDFPNIKK